MSLGCFYDSKDFFDIQWDNRTTHQNCLFELIDRQILWSQAPIRAAVAKQRQLHPMATTAANGGTLGEGDVYPLSLGKLTTSAMVLLKTMPAILLVQS